MKNLVCYIVFSLFVQSNVSSQQDFTETFNSVEIDNKTHYLNLFAQNTDPDSLYDAQNFDYYQKVYKSAKIRRNVGLVFIPVGGGFLVWGIAKIMKSIDEGDSSENYRQFRQGLGLSFGGAVLFTGGIVFSVSGGKKRRHAKRAMEKLESNMTLSVGVANNGIGLVLKF